MLRKVSARATWKRLLAWFAAFVKCWYKYPSLSVFHCVIMDWSGLQVDSIPVRTYHQPGYRKSRTQFLPNSRSLICLKSPPLFITKCVHFANPFNSHFVKIILRTPFFSPLFPSRFLGSITSSSAAQSQAGNLNYYWGVCGSEDNSGKFAIPIWKHISIPFSEKNPGKVSQFDSSVSILWTRVQHVPQNNFSALPNKFQAH